MLDMNIADHVLKVLDDTLQLQGQTRSFGPDTPLLGALPELDSMAVVALISGLEDHFGITFDDADLTAAAFANVSSLSRLVEHQLA